MNILICAAEMAPLVKVGGLADVTGSLSRALAASGHRVGVVLPLYGSIDRRQHNVEPSGIAFTISVKGELEPARAWAGKNTEGVDLFLIEHEGHFGPEQVYTSNDLDRFFYFSLAAAELVRHLDWRPDIFHCHDWHTAIAPALFATDLRLHSPYDAVATVFTIHNLAYQGWFDYDWAQKAGVVRYIPPLGHPLHHLLWRTMGLGIYYADVVSTVSNTYAREILTAQYGEGLDPVLRERQSDLFGIVNGIDCSTYNPHTDRNLGVNYKLSTISRRRTLKRALQQEVGLPVEDNAPLLAYIGRFTRQKGVSLMASALEPFLTDGRVQLVVLGQAAPGEESYREVLEDLQSRHPDRARVIARFSEPLAHRIYAGCDLFLMPSLFEPCGLGQLIALRYGAIPVVRHTGGLVDTVVEHPIYGNGFVFHDPESPNDMEAAIERALSAYRSSGEWALLQARAMSSDVSMDRACKQYETLYRHAIERKRSRR